MKYTIHIGRNCYLDLDNDLIIRDDIETPLSRTQVHLLHALARSLGRPVSSDTLIKVVWGTRAATFVSKKDLYIVIHRLRKRIEWDCRNPKFLIAVKGYGYMLNPVTTMSKVVQEQ